MMASQGDLPERRPPNSQPNTVHRYVEFGVQKGIGWKPIAHCELADGSLLMAHLG